MKENAIIKLQDLDSHKKVNEFSLICYAIMCMDSNFLFDLLDDGIDYEDIGKTSFVIKLKNRFIEHKIMGDSELVMDLDYCLGCNCDKPICRFIGNNSKKHFGLYFEMKDDKIIDIYHCNLYGSSNLDDLP